MTGVARVAPTPPYAAQAVVFDLDGLLVDSEDAWRRATRTVVEDLGGIWDDALHRALLGSGPAVAARMVAEHVGNGYDATDVAPRMLQAAADELARGLEVRVGALELVRALHGRVPLAVATNSQHLLAQRALDGTDLSGWFEAVVCADDVAVPKPAPDAYLAACRECAVRPELAVAFEDSPTGTQAARAAGLWVVGCPSLPGVSLPAAHAVVASLADVDPALLIQSSPASGLRGSRESPT